ncbi:methyltransferase domain-containing protein [Micromonospora sp. NPDC005220]|uniref:class I SAM-dependent methyltransferase n=1 Tax=Micromonospora sp. NPDC005220 TaxID=3155589 RepID=UPI0033BF3DE4
MPGEATDDSVSTPDLAEVFDRAAPRYDRTGVHFFGPIGARLVDGLKLCPGEDVLDVGCGQGACTVPAARAVTPGGSVIGIDVAPAMVEGARDEIADEGLTNVDVRIGDATKPGFAPASFDAVVAGLVMFMLPDPADAAARYHRLVRPGGRFAMSTFGADDPAFFHVTDAVVPFVEGGMPPVPGRTDNPLRSKEGIHRLLRDAGFADTRIDDETLDLEFTDPRQWWDWLWQTAGRMVLERVPEERLGEARAAAEDRMRQVAADRGRLVVHWNVWYSYTTAG